MLCITARSYAVDDLSHNMVDPVFKLTFNAAVMCCALCTWSYSVVVASDLYMAETALDLDEDST